MTTLQTPLTIPTGEVISLPAPVEVHIYSNGSLFGVVNQDHGDLFLKGVAGLSYVKVVTA